MDSLRLLRFAAKAIVKLAAAPLAALAGAMLSTAVLRLWMMANKLLVASLVLAVRSSVKPSTDSMAHPRKGEE